MPAQVTKVNLLPPSDFEQSFWGRFLKWAVTTGRYLIILTELVVIMAFLSRFKLDDDLRKLNEQISGQVSYLNSQQRMLEEFKQLQHRMELGSQILKTRVDPITPLNNIDEKLNEDLMVKRREVYPKEISITAVTLSEQAMGQLSASMSADKQWAALDLTSVSGDKTNGIQFTLSAKK